MYRAPHKNYHRVFARKLGLDTGGEIKKDGHTHFGKPPQLQGLSQGLWFKLAIFRE